jgi:hypothetical protein
MFIRSCFGRWELKNSTQYSVLSTQKNLLAAMRILRKNPSRLELSTEYCVPSTGLTLLILLRRSGRLGSCLALTF